MNGTFTNVDQSTTSGVSDTTIVLIGIGVNIFINILMCVERTFKRIGSSSCVKKRPDGTETRIDFKESNEQP